MSHFRPYLDKPRRGRVESGTVCEWANRFGVLDKIKQACSTQEVYCWVVGTPVFTGYLGVNAGFCGTGRQLYIELHSVLMEPVYVKTEGPTTFLHEVGHLIDVVERGTSDHSKAWRQIMTKLGEPDEGRCHPIPVTVMRAAKAVLVCPVCSSITHTTKPEKYEGVRTCSYCKQAKLVRP